jgi:hypothetical protein
MFKWPMSFHGGNYLRVGFIGYTIPASRQKAKDGRAFNHSKYRLSRLENTFRNAAFIARDFLKLRTSARHDPPLSSSSCPPARLAARE